MCVRAQAGGSGVLRQRAERELRRRGRAAPAVSDTGEGVGVGQAAPLHRPGAEESRLRRRKLVVALVFLVFLVQIHLTAPERVQGEAGAAAAGGG